MRRCFKQFGLFFLFVFFVGCSNDDGLLIEKESFFIVTDKSKLDSNYIVYLEQIPTKENNGSGIIRWAQLAPNSERFSLKSMQSESFSFDSGIRFEDINLSYHLPIGYLNKIELDVIKSNSNATYNPEVCVTTFSDLRELFKFDVIDCKSKSISMRVSRQELAESDLGLLSQRKFIDDGIVQFNNRNIEKGKWMFFLYGPGKSNESHVIGVRINRLESESQNLLYEWVLIQDVKSTQQRINVFETEFKTGKDFAIANIDSQYLINISGSNISQNLIVKIDNSEFYLHRVRVKKDIKTQFCFTELIGDFGFQGFSINDCESLIELTYAPN